MILAILIWLIGSILSYFMIRKYFRINGQYSKSDRIINIILSLILSWISVVITGIALLAQINVDKPAKW
jgi:positive regulator of sigma E activity